MKYDQNVSYSNCAIDICIYIFYHSGFLDYCLHLYCYIPNVSADISSSPLQLFVELRSLHGTSNHILYLIHGGHLF